MLPGTGTSLRISIVQSGFTEGKMIKRREMIERRVMQLAQREALRDN